MMYRVFFFEIISNAKKTLKQSKENENEYKSDLNEIKMVRINQNSKKKKKKKMQYTISKHFTKHKIFLLKFLIIFLHSHLILDIKRLMENDSKF